MLITFPNVLTVDESRAGNRIRQIGELTLQTEGTLSPFARGRLQGFLFTANIGAEETLVIPKAKQLPDNHLRVIEATVPAANGDVDLRNGAWLRHPLQNGFHHERAIREVL